MANHKSVSLKKNFLMNALLTSSNFIFPLITFPYVSRILLADGNGKINFATSIINYFLMLSSLGIPLYGVRSCAVVRDDKRKLSRLVQELFIVNIITTILSLLLLLVSIAVVPKFQDYEGLLLILSCNIWLRTIGMEWLYQALEQYSYITIRSLVFKVIGIVLMFAFVRQHSDYMIYALVTVIGGSGSLVLNFVRVFSIVDRVPLSECNLKRHIKPILGFFLLSAAWSMYANMDIALLGFLSNDTQTGYYGAAIKIKQMLLACISALGTVMLPRLSNYYGKHKEAEFYALLRKNSSFIMIAGFAITFFCIINAKPIIVLLSGNTYVPAVPAMQIVMIPIILSGVSTMLGNNVLIAQGKERVTTIATLVSFIVIIAIDYFLIPKFGAIGAAIGTAIGTFVVVAIEVIYLKSNISSLFEVSSIYRSLLSGLLASAVMIVVSNFVPLLDRSIFMGLLVNGFVFCIVYAVALMVFREKFILDTLRGLRK